MQIRSVCLEPWVRIARWVRFPCTRDAAKIRALVTFGIVICKSHARKDPAAGSILFKDRGSLVNFRLNADNSFERAGQFRIALKSHWSITATARSSATSSWKQARAADRTTTKAVAPHWQFQWFKPDGTIKMDENTAAVSGAIPHGRTGNPCTRSTKCVGSSSNESTLEARNEDCDPPSPPS